jgi:hypothetical protein
LCGWRAREQAVAGGVDHEGTEVEVECVYGGEVAVGDEEGDERERRLAAVVGEEEVGSRGEAAPGAAAEERLLWQADEDLPHDELLWKSGAGWRHGPKQSAGDDRYPVSAKRSNFVTIRISYFRNYTSLILRPAITLHVVAGTIANLPQ